MRSGAHNQLGAHGENLVAEFLVSKGYEVLERNLVLKLGEIDLLCRDGAVLVVVEVKTVTKLGAIDPIYKINPAKQRKLHLLAEVIAAKCPDRMIRVDAVTVYFQENIPVIQHYKNIHT